MKTKPHQSPAVQFPVAFSEAPTVRISHSPGRSLRSPGKTAPEFRALKGRHKNPHSSHAICPRDVFAPQTAIKSQGATIGGPLKFSWPPEILSSILSTAELFSCSTFSPFGRVTLVFESIFKGCHARWHSSIPWPPSNLDSDLKTKDAQMLTKKVSTFEKSERLSFLS